MQVLSYKIQKLKGRGKLIRRNRKSKIAIAMEFGLRRSGQGGGGVVKEEKRSTESSGTDGDDHEPPPDHHQQDTTLVEVQPNNSSGRSMVETVVTACSKEEVDEELESARAEMGEVREENERLKTLLERIMKEYEALQMQFQVIANQDQTDMVSLSLGRLPSKSQDKTKVTSKELDDDLALGLDCKFETSKSGSSTELAFPNNNSSPTNSSQLPKEEEAAESTLPPSKASSRDHSNVDQDEVSQQNPAKKARVCVRARCDTPTMNDGCQWRKYGQKISKGNPCPRAYYRCTVAPNCPVRKQVQRCADDMSILITTYEGTHSHPLPLSATAMASTTSAAASMLMSGSSSSTSHHPPPSTSAATTASDHLHGLNLYLSSSDGIIGSKPKQFYLSNPALSPSPSHPTITLDLTTTSNNNIPSSSSNRFINLPPRFPSSSTSLSFTTSSEPNNAFTWGNHNNNAFLTYNTQLTHQPFNNNNRSINMNILNNNNNNNINLGRQLPMSIPTQNSSLPDTIAAATKVITADPSFQSALAAALSSIIGTGSTNNSGIGISAQALGVGESLGHINKNITKLGESSTNSKVNTNGCAASSFFNRTASSASTVQTGSTSLVFLQPPSLPFSSSKSASPGDHNRDNNSNS